MTVAPEATALDAARAVAAALGDDITAVYVVGSVALRGFRPGASDLDVIAVSARPLSHDEKQAVVERVRDLDVAPARGLELVVYAAGRLALNVNTGPGMDEHVGYDPTDEPQFWFVLDRAIAQEHAVVLVGPPWRELFPPVSRAEVLHALESSLDWHERHGPASANALLNALRARRYAEAGVWASKPDVAGTLLDEVRRTLEAAS